MSAEPSGARQRTTGDPLSIVLVYPGLLGTYGDRGNALVLAYRARRRGIPVRLVTVAAGEPVPSSADVYVIGGGEDEAQTVAATLLASDGGLVSAVRRGAAVLAVCAGFQILGTLFPGIGGAACAGLGLIDMRTDPTTQPRAVGELLVEADPEAVDLPPLTGYENHAGRSRLGPGITPLGRVRTGIGNGDGTDGALVGSIVGTYLHGPVLARNPALADWLLTRAVGAALAPLPSPQVERLRAERLAALGLQREVSR